LITGENVLAIVGAHGKLGALDYNEGLGFALSEVQGRAAGQGRSPLKTKAF